MSPGAQWPKTEMREARGEGRWSVRFRADCSQGITQPSWAVHRPKDSSAWGLGGVGLVTLGKAFLRDHWPWGEVGIQGQALDLNAGKAQLSARTQRPEDGAGPLV